MSKKQINVLQQHLDESNVKIEELQAQINELKDQAGTSTKPVSADMPVVDATADTTMENLFKRFNEYPWTILLIIVVVGIAFVVLIILINNMRSAEIQPLEKDFEFRERVPDNELKARIKQKLSQREANTENKTGNDPFSDKNF